MPEIVGAPIGASLALATVTRIVWSAVFRRDPVLFATDRLLSRLLTRRPSSAKLLRLSRADGREPVQFTTVRSGSTMGMFGGSLPQSNGTPGGMCSHSIVGDEQGTSSNGLVPTKTGWNPMNAVFDI